jgi:hypothetical protein
MGKKAGRKSGKSPFLKRTKPIHRGGPGVLNPADMKLWIAFRDRKLAGIQQPGRERIQELFREFKALHPRRQTLAASARSKTKRRILPAHYPVPDNPQMLKLYGLKLSGMTHADIAALAEALITRLNSRPSDDLQAAIRELLDSIRAFAIDTGGDLMATIGFDDFFRWPSTLAPGGSGNLPTIDWDKDGLLSAFGYHVGLTSPLSGTMRRAILERIYRTPLGSDIPAEIRSEWGQASTSKRLRKLANTIAALTRNAKRNHAGSYGVAVREWEEDLYYLYVHHYVGKYGFPWPTTGSRR